MRERTMKITDRDGEKLETRFSNGIIERILIKPSRWYIENVMNVLTNEGKKHQAQIEHELKVQQKMREMAIRELGKEGKL